MNPLAAYNFACLPGQRKMDLTSPLSWLIIATLAIGSMLFVTGLWHTYSLTRASTALSVSLQRAESDARPAPTPPKAPTISKVHADAINAAVHQLNVPWRDILDAIEQATPHHIALLGIEPDSSRQLIRITGEARSTDSMLAYLEQLNRSTFFSAAAMSQHITNEQDPQKPLRFTIEAYYQGTAMEPPQ